MLPATLAPMTDTFRLRRGRPEDTRRAFDVFLPAVKDLTVRQGVPWEPDAENLWSTLAPMMEHLAHHAAEWWVAEDRESGDMIGYARSIERGGLFELSEFFVHPDRQSAGVGGALLARAFPEGRGDVRAIIATTDVRAQARYYRAGTAARFPIVAMSGPPGPDGDAPADPELEVTRLGEVDIPALIEIEAAVLEFDRGDEFRWLLEQREGYLYRRAGKALGFAFVGPTGTGPIAALRPEDQVPMLAHVEGRSAALGVKELSFEVPMVNDVAMRHLLGRGFRLDTFLTLLMSSRPFGQFDRFICFQPPFVL
jgi:GNAT superfamily N-acetyltransferase